MHKACSVPDEVLPSPDHAKTEPRMVGLSIAASWIREELHSRRQRIRSSELSPVLIDRRAPMPEGVDEMNADPLV